MIEYRADGTVLLTDPLDSSVTEVVIGDQATIDAAIEAFFPPDSVPMYKVKKLFALILFQGGPDYHQLVIDGINTLPEPNRTLALIDFGPQRDQIGSPNLLVFSPLAIGLAAGMGLTRDEYYTLVRTANAMA